MRVSASTDRPRPKGLGKNHVTGNWDLGQKLTGNWDWGPPIMTPIKIIGLDSVVAQPKKIKNQNDQVLISRKSSFTTIYPDYHRSSGALGTISTYLL